jgi:hypothetical protein
MSMAARLAEALSTPADYSCAFTERIRELGRHLSSVLGLTMSHNESMDYAAGQMLVLYLDSAACSTESNSPEADYMISLFLSSRGRFVAVHVRHRDSSPARDYRVNRMGTQWMLTRLCEVPFSIQGVIDRLGSAVASDGWEILDETVLNRLVPGAFTKLDGKPATVFEVLFSEVLS